MKPQSWLIRIALSAVTLIILVLLCAAPAAAIGVLGAKYTGSIAPGGTDTHVVTIDIGADEPATDVLVEVEGFGQNANGVYIPLDPANDLNPYSARSFISLANSTIHLVPGTKQSITATINVPQNVGPGGRYAILYIRSLPGAGSSLSTAVVVPVFITVTGTTPTETGSILQVGTGAVTIGQPITITTTFKNTGNYHYYNAVNEVTVKDSNGALVANASTTPMVYALIPGNTVQFVTQPNVNNLQAGTYTVDSKVLLGGQVLDENSTTFTLKTNYVPPATESSITVSPGSPATLTSPDGRYSVSFPQGAVLSDVVVTLGPYPSSQLNRAPSGAKLGATSFQITGLSGLLSKAATVKVTYSADDLAAAGGDASQLKLSYYDTAQGSWVILPTQVNTQDMTLSATTNQLGVWAVMVSSSTSAGAPSSSSTKAPLPAMLSIAAFAAVVIIVNNTGRRRQ
ncbi:hypothetical protein [Methanoregula sp.]|uniref:hypothetical protein n=1 Tax=Methanoregula sp. TaxID=2052170 RepID=UPI003C748148